jgi:two-component system nitrogen regulation response regulator GlnG
VRLIAATNKDLEKLVAEKHFREDLYYRINVVRIKLPPLRERLDDVPALVDFMVQRLANDKKIRVRKVSAEALAVLCAYTWPGNVRELENAVYRSGVVAQGDTVLLKDLPREILQVVQGWSSGENGRGKMESGKEEKSAGGAEEKKVAANGEAGLTLAGAYDAVYRLARAASSENILEGIEAEMIARALKETDGNHVKAAALLGITRTTLRKRVDGGK